MAFRNNETPAPSFSPELLNRRYFSVAWKSIIGSTKRKNKQGNLPYTYKQYQREREAAIVAGVILLNALLALFYSVVNVSITPGILELFLIISVISLIVNYFDHVQTAAYLYLLTAEGCLLVIEIMSSYVEGIGAYTIMSLMLLAWPIVFAILVLPGKAVTLITLFNDFFIFILVIIFPHVDEAAEWFKTPAGYLFRIVPYVIVFNSFAIVGYLASREERENIRRVVENEEITRVELTRVSHTYQSGQIFNALFKPDQLHQAACDFLNVQLNYPAVIVLGYKEIEQRLVGFYKETNHDFQEIDLEIAPDQDVNNATGLENKTIRTLWEKALLNKDGFLLTQTEIAEDSLQKLFGEQHIWLIIPVIYHKIVYGLIAVGKGKTIEFTAEDNQMLGLVERQLALNFDNQRLYKQVSAQTRLEQELQAARLLQSQLFPSTLPQVTGLTLTAFCQPAKETSGDFYDMLWREEKLSLVIGDVAGKSLPAALVMVAACQTARVIMSETAEPSEALIALNQQMYHLERKDKFVALLYATIEPQSNCLYWSNAGQIPIVLIREGVVTFLEAEGDRWPLGIFPEVIYQTGTQNLNPGDLLVFSTDGLVEALNEEGELFGFERMFELLRQCSGLKATNAETLILNEINRFSGSTAPSDDFTLIVISIDDKIKDNIEDRIETKLEGRIQ